MTVPTQVTRNDAIAIAGQVAYDFGFEALTDADLQVYVNGLPESGGYTIARNIAPQIGGTVTFFAPYIPTAGQNVSLVLEMPLDRTTDYQNSGDFLASAVNADFDKIYIGAIQNENFLDRTLRLQNVDPTPSNGEEYPMALPLTDARKDRILAFNNIGVPIAGPKTSDITDGLSLKSTLTNGNVTGGTDIDISVGDSITTLNSGIKINRFYNEGDFASNSATGLATQQSIKTYVDSAVGLFDSLSEVLANGNTSGGNDISMSSGDNIIFAGSSGQLKIGSDPRVNIDATGVDLFGAVFLKSQIGQPNSTLGFSQGATVNEFSIDGTLSGNSDTSLPTEKAVKTYVDNAVPAAESLANTLIAGNVTSGTNIEVSTSDAVQFGTSVSNNLKISHDGTVGLIKEIGSGYLKIQGDQLDIRGNDGTSGITISPVPSQTYNDITFQTGPSGSVQLYVTADGVAFSTGQSVQSIQTSTALSTSNTTLSTTGAIKSYVDTAVAGLPVGDITAITATAPITGGGTSGAVSIGINQATTSQSGYLSNTDWNTFNSKSTFSGAYADLTGKPTIPTNNNELINGAGYITSAGVPSSVTSVSATATGGITVTGSPITTSGTLAFALDSTVVKTTGTQTISGKTMSGVILDGNVNGTGVLDSTQFPTGADNNNIASALAVKTYVDAQVGTSDTLKEVLVNGNVTDGSNLVISSGDAISIGGQNSTDTVTTIDASSTDTDLATALAIKTYVDSSVPSAESLKNTLAAGNISDGTDLIMSTGDDLTISAGSSLDIKTAGLFKLNNAQVSDIVNVIDASTSSADLVTGTAVKNYVTSVLPSSQSLSATLAVGNSTGGTDIELSPLDTFNVLTSGSVSKTVISRRLGLPSIGNITLMGDTDGALFEADEVHYSSEGKKRLQFIASGATRFISESTGAFDFENTSGQSIIQFANNGAISIMSPNPVPANSAIAVGGNVVIDNLRNIKNVPVIYNNNSGLQAVDLNNSDSLIFNTPDGHSALLLSGGSFDTNYYSNETHYFRGIDGLDIHAIINTSGIRSLGNLQLGSSTAVTSILDEDDMASDSSVALATQQSIKAYVNAQVGTADSLSEVLANGNTTGSNNILFGANNKAIFNSSFEIYRDASNAIISETGAGSLILRGTNLILQSDDNDAYIQCIENGSVTLYQQIGGSSAPRLNTTTVGVNVTGTMESDSLLLGSGATVTEISTGTSLSTSNTTLSTTGAIKSYVDTAISGGGFGTVTSVASTIGGNAIAVGGSPITSNGTLAYTFQGSASQYINGAGNLVTFPTDQQGVTSVASTVTGNALTVSGSPVTSTGTLAYAWAGNASEYINGAGNLTAFPSIPSVGNGVLTIATSGTVSGSGTFTANQSGNATITIVGDAFPSIPTVNDSTITFTAGNKLSGGGTITLNQSNAETVSFGLASNNVSQFTNDAGYLTGVTGFLPLSGGTLTGGLLGTTASFSGTTSLNNSSINFGFASGSAEIKPKGSSGSLSAGIDLFRTNSSGFTLLGLRILPEGGLSVSTGAVTMDGLLEGVTSLQMGGALTGASSIQVSGTTISSISTSTSLGTSNTSLSTTGAIKSYVDTAVASVPVGDITNISVSSPITGGGSSGSIGIGIQVATASQAGFLSAANFNTFNNKSNFSGAYADLTGKPTIPTNNNQLTNGAGYTTNTGTTTASNTQTFTNKSGNISQWTNNSGYLTSVTGFLPLTGGTLTGNLTGTTATFNNTVTLSGSGLVNITKGLGVYISANLSVAGLIFNTNGGAVEVSGDLNINSGGLTGANSIGLSGVTVSSISTSTSLAGASNTQLVTALAVKTYVDNSPVGDITGVAVTSPLTGGGTSGNVTVAIQQASGSQAGFLSAANWTTFNNKSTFSGAYSDLTGKPTIPTNNNQLTNGAGYITSSAVPTNNNQLTNGAGYTTNTGTVTSVTINGNAYSASGSTGVTIAPQGNATQYINGQGNLTTFPSIPSSVTNNNQLINGAGYTTNLGFARYNAGTTYSSYTNLQRFYSNTNMATSAGSQSSLECFSNGSGNDAFMTFHVGGDYATYLGLDGGTNKLSTGGWSAGAVSHAIFHEGNVPTYSQLGSMPYSNLSGTPTIPTNNNQLSNGAGYITSAPTVYNAAIQFNANANMTGGGLITLNQSNSGSVNFDSFTEDNITNPSWTGSLNQNGTGSGVAQEGRIDNGNGETVFLGINSSGRLCGAEYETSITMSLQQFNNLGSNTDTTVIPGRAGYIVIPLESMYIMKCSEQLDPASSIGNDLPNLIQIRQFGPTSSQFTVSQITGQNILDASVTGTSLIQRDIPLVQRAYKENSPTLFRFGGSGGGWDTAAGFTSMTILLKYRLIKTSDYN